MRFSKALLLSGVVGFSQILTAAVESPGSTASLTERTVARADHPSVIELMLDEHTGMAAIPAEAVPPDQVKAFVDAYVQHGFIVFTHAYTADITTEASMARLWNLDTSDPEKLLERKNPSVSLVSQAATLDALGKDYALDITTIPEVDPTPALAKNPALARQLSYHINNVNDVVRDLPLSYGERMRIATSMSLYWLVGGIESPLATWFLQTGVGKKVEAAFRFQQNRYAIVARAVLHDLSRRLEKSGERGTYYFAHLIFPHRPYLFEKDCRMIPISQWQGWKRNETLDPQKRLDSYRLHMDQATCAASEVFDLIEGMRKRPELSDAVLLVHSDHGARTFLASGEHKETDGRGSFIAIRIPGMEGGVVDTPVRLDRFYKDLMENHFRKLDFDKLKPLPDSPY